MSQEETLDILESAVAGNLPTAKLVDFIEAGRSANFAVVLGPRGDREYAINLVDWTVGLAPSARFVGTLEGVIKAAAHHILENR